MKMTRKLILMGGIMLAAASLWADTETVGGYTWTYDVNGDTAEICNGFGAAISPEPTGAVTVPSTLGGKPVTSIGMYAFRSCSGLTSVTIPDSVTSIGDRAFYGCSGMTSVTIPDSVTSIGEYAFRDCSGLTSVTMPDGVTSIGEGAFSGCYGLTSVTVPDSVTSIGRWVFSDCSDALFDTTTIPGVKLVDGWAVGYTGSLSGHLDLTGIRGIGDSAFSGCSGLTGVTIPGGVTSIGPYAFSGCSGLTSVTIPDSVTSIGDNAFYGCTALTDVECHPAAAGLAWGDASDDFKADGSTEIHVKASQLAAYQAKFSRVNATFVGDIDMTPEIAPEPGPCYQMLNEGDIVEPYAAPKAVTLTGVVYDGCDVVGIVELKLGKVNAKKKTSKVSGSMTTLDGKKHTAKGVTVTGIDGTAPAVVSLEVKGLGTLSVTIGGDKFAGSLGAWHVQSAEVGGNWTGSSATAEVIIDDVSMFTGEVLQELLPYGEQATVSNGKWSFKKAASVKWAKPKGAAEKSLIVNTSKGTNLSGLKLTYTPKKGTFKGSFNVYALVGEDKSTKLKKYKVNVTGVVVGGVGYGVATSKKPAVTWQVTVQ